MISRKNVMAFCLYLALSASVYAPSQAQEQHSDTVPKTTSRPFWIWQILANFQPGSAEDAFNARLAQELAGQGSIPRFGSNRFIISPFYLSWNHNKWIIMAGYSGTLGTAVSSFISGTEYDEIFYGFGYSVVNSQRFRLYPFIGFRGDIQRITLTEPTTLSNALKTFTPNSITIQRTASIIELSVGADYNFALEYGDLYIMARIGYNFEFGQNWTLGRQYLADADPNWFSRRGIFFHLGIGLGTERR
ncbi:MAG: hypothetical protein MUF71_03095 [Candidatus Kapabacteria bacterium]|jgi:hypothetical protein|nr:hypothetical protein [Candidatus Kapabacteria bacterium]